MSIEKNALIARLSLISSNSQEAKDIHFTLFEQEHCTFQELSDLISTIERLQK